MMRNKVDVPAIIACIANKQVNNPKVFTPADKISGTKRVTIKITERLTDDDVEKLAHALENNDVLQVLILNFTGITEKGAFHLAQALASNRTLVELHLFGNQIRSMGAVHIADALKRNKKSALKLLDIAQNEADPSIITYFNLAVKDNLALRELYLGIKPGKEPNTKVFAVDDKTCIPLEPTLLAIEKETQEILKARKSPLTSNRYSLFNAHKPVIAFVRDSISATKDPSPRSAPAA